MTKKIVKNKPKKPRTIHNALENLPTPSRAELAKAAVRLKGLQAIAIARSLTPIPANRKPKFRFITKEDIVKYQATIMELNLDRLLSGHDMSAQSHAVRNIIMVVCPPQTNIAVIQSSGTIMFEGKKISNAVDLDEVMRIGGIEYAATHGANPTT